MKSQIPNQEAPAPKKIADHPTLGISTHYRIRRIQRRIVQLAFFATTLCLATLWIALLFPAPGQRAAEINRTIALQSNQLLRTNAVAQWSVGIMLHRVGRRALQIVIVCAIAWALVRSPTPPRLAGYILWTLLWATLAYQIADKIGDVVHVDSPDDVIVGVNSVAQILGKEFDGEEADDFPHDITVAMACGLTLLFFRLPLAATIAAALPAMTWIAMILDGRAWALNHAASVIIGTAIAAFAYSFSRSILRPTERWTEQTIARLMAHGPHWIRTASAQIDTRAIIEIQKTRRKRIEKMWQRLVTRELAPFLKPMTRGRLTPSPRPNDTTHSKPSRYVRFLHTLDGQKIVVKAAWKPFGFIRRSRRIERYESSAHKHLTLEQIGIPVPRVLWQSTGYIGPALHRFYLIAEEYVESRPAIAGYPADAQAAAECLARLHKHRSARWGELGIDDCKTHAYPQMRLRPTIHHALNARALPTGNSWIADLEDLCWQRIARAFQHYASHTRLPFALIHGDVGTQNFRFQNQTLVLIDFLTMGYDLTGPEILQAAVRFGNANPTAFQAFWKTYFKAVGENGWNDFLAQAELASTLFFLHELGHHRTCIQMKNPEDAARIAETIDHLLATAKHTFENGPEATDTRAIFHLLHLPMPHPDARTPDA